MAVKLNPTGDLYIDLNNVALSRFTPEQRQRIGIHTCPPGGDKDSTHSADVDYADLLPTLFELCVALAVVHSALGTALMFTSSCAGVTAPASV